MSADFNITEEEKNQEENKQISNKTGVEELRNNLIKLAIIIGGCLLLLFVIMYISSLFSKKQYTYEEIEQVMKTGAISYFKTHPENLPKTEKQTVTISAETLSETGNMKRLSSYTKETCTGKVTVVKRSTEYVYTPYLSCGDNYSSQEMYSLIVNSSNIVTKGYGLYKMNGEYVYRGEKVNNYVKLDNSIWRIVKLTSDNKIVLIGEDVTNNITAPWDDRYNTEMKYNSGINNYSSSRIKEYLEDIYNETNDGLNYLTVQDKSHFTSYELCVGKRLSTEKTKDNSVECKHKAKTQIGLLTVSDYMNASIDPNCNVTESYSCQNYNYLATRYKWWLITAALDNTYQAYAVKENGVITLANTGDYSYIRPVVYLNSTTKISGGDGTLENPYILK